MLYVKPFRDTHHLPKRAEKVVKPTDAKTQMPFDELTLRYSTASSTVKLFVIITIVGLEENKEYESWIRVLWESGLSQSANTRKYTRLCTKSNEVFSQMLRQVNA